LLLVLDFAILFNSPFAVGIDGYYYVVQVDYLYHEERFYFPTYNPAVLYFLTALKLIFGETVVSIKIAAIILHLSLCLGIFFLVKTITGNYLSGLFSVYTIELSGLHRYMYVEYLNHLGAVSFLVWGAFFTILASKKKRITWNILALLTFFLSISSHRSGLAVLTTLLIVYGVVVGTRAAVATKNKSGKIFFSVLTVSLFILPAMVAFQPFFHLTSDWEKHLTYDPQIPIRFATFPELIILMVFSVIIVVFVWIKRHQIEFETGHLVIGVVLLWGILITFNPFISSDRGFSNLGGRLRVLAFIQVAILVPLTIWAIKDSSIRFERYAMVLFIPLMAWSFLKPLPFGARSEFVDKRAKLIEVLRSNPLKVEADSLIIADHGEQFVITAMTKIRSQQRFPERTNHQPIYWLMNSVPPAFVDSSMTIISKDSTGSYAVLIEDGEDWRGQLNKPELRRGLRKSNRHLDKFLTDNNFPW
jgi:hypothetical protein